MKITQWKCLTACAILAASVLPIMANDDPTTDILTGHGLVWNSVPGVAGEPGLSFDLNVDLETGTGFATVYDPIHPDRSLDFAIHSTQRETLHSGEIRYIMAAEIDGSLGNKQKSWNPANFRIVAEIDGSLGNKQKSWNPANFRSSVLILAETRGDSTGINIELGETSFDGAAEFAVDVTTKPRNITYRSSSVEASPSAKSVDVTFKPRNITY
jgi:hypothetical protein